MIYPEKASMLGSPLDDVSAIDSYLAEKIQTLRLVGSQFTHMSAHDSFSYPAQTLLCHPKVTVSLSYFSMLFVM